MQQDMITRMGSSVLQADMDKLARYEPAIDPDTGKVYQPLTDVLRGALAFFGYVDTPDSMTMAQYRYWVLFLRKLVGGHAQEKIDPVSTNIKGFDDMILNVEKGVKTSLRGRRKQRRRKRRNHAIASLIEFDIIIRRLMKWADMRETKKKIQKARRSRISRPKNSLESYEGRSSNLASDSSTR